MTPKGKKVISMLFIACVCGAIFLVIFRKQNKVETGQQPGVYSHTTEHAQTITVRDSHPTSPALSTVTITTEGFKNNTPITLEKNKLISVYFTDLNADGYDEIVITFASQTPPHYGEAIVFTTTDESDLLPVELPNINEEDTSSGGLFEGYLGDDIFVAEKNRLLRTFSVEDSTDENESQTPPLETEATDETSPDGAPEGFEVATTSNTYTEELASTTQEKQKPKKQKTILYALIDKDGYFSLEPKNVDQPKQLTASSTAAISSTSWRWLSLNYKGSPVVPDEDSMLTVTFADDGTFTASSSCDMFTGGYATTGSILRLGSLVTSSTADTSGCSSNISLFKELIPLAETFVIRDNQLMISLGQKNGTFLFVRQ